MTTQPRVWLIDASVYIFRAWFSMPDRWYTADGMPLNAVIGYAGFLYDALTHNDACTHIAAAFDESLGSCFRNEIYAGYKASRELPDEALAFQLLACREVTERAGIPCYGGPRYEADDYIATLARLARQEQVPVTVLTRDKDLGQLLEEQHDCWWDFAADHRLDRLAFVERFGVKPEQFADYLGLVGDAIDDIPGIPGVGPKTAAGLLQAYGDLEGIAAHAGEIASLPLRGASSLWGKMEPHWAQALVSRQLARLEAAIPGLDRLPAFSPAVARGEAVADYLASLGVGGRLRERWHGLGEGL
ncbi:5'-3' exonuclease [Haliea sp. E17]|uniref:5'-3' exonuclease n=1 Tax=Haliea sp. E17 TaxID=3401576 RepID=UPI003AAFC132